MSEIKPVYQIRASGDFDWWDVTKQQYEDTVGSSEYNTRILYPAAALETQTKRANALALVIRDLTKMVTHDAETKDQLIERIKKILSFDPDFRVSEFESELEALQEELDDEKQKGAALWKNVELKCEEIEALQAENEELKRNVRNVLKERKHQEDTNIKLREESAAQAKRIAELESPQKPKMAPVQGYVQGIPWDMHLEAYNAYCKRYGAQQALIEGGCRGGFGVGELDMFIPGWREKLSLVGKLNVEIEALRKQLETAVNRINDLLQDDDGQAHKEARKFVESLSAQKGTE